MSRGLHIAMKMTLAIIAGGLGRRMGGPKHGLRIGGEPILCTMLDRLGWTGPTMLVVGVDAPKVHGQERVDQVVADSVGGEGPLRGILTALERCGTEALVTIPIDMPGLRAEHVRWLMERGLASACERTMLRRVAGGRRLIEPFPAFFRASSAAQIRRLLAGGQHALRALADLSGTEICDAPSSWDERVWVNVNTPEDAAALGAALVPEAV